MIFTSNFRVEATANTIWVDDNIIYPELSNGSISNPFKYIQSAIYAANDGDTIKVLPGSYSGDFIVNRSVRITTENASSTYITSKAKNSYMIEITASFVSFEGFTIIDNTTTSHRKAVFYVAPSAYDVRIIDNLITKSYNGYGILIEGSTDSQNAVISNNTIDNTNGVRIVSSNSNSFFKNKISNCIDKTAIEVVNSNVTLIENNTLNNNLYGIYVSGNSKTLSVKNNTIENNTNNGIALGSGSGNYVENNTIHNNGNSGIVLGSTNSIIFNNSIKNASIGINLAATGCTIYNNSIFDCKTNGIYAQSVSNNNKIFNNTFTDKLSQYHAIDYGNNYWDDTIFNGNYWDDYYGPDNDKDLRGDIPYITGGVEDNYPKGIFQMPPQISDPSPSHLATGVSKQPTLSVKVVDPEKKRVNVNFYVIIDNESRLINDYPVSAESGGRASVPFYQIAEGKNAVYTYLGTGYDYICVWYAIVYDEYSSNSSVDAAGTEWIFTTLETPVNNEKPIADIGGPYTTKIGEPVQFDGSGCTDPDGTIQFYRWSFGDGEAVINVKSPTHTYLTNGTATVSLVVIDNNGASSSNTTTIEVRSTRNEPPVSNPGGPYEAFVGDSITFYGAGSYDPENKQLNYSWDFGDGFYENIVSPTHTYSQAGTYLLTLIVNDPEGERDISTTSVLIKTKQEEKSPGFEMVFVLLAMLFVYFIIKKNKSK